ncbi:MAG: heme exporter protein CcmD [Pseudomonadota bacterium]
MEALGPHAGFILAAYISVFFVLIALLLWLALDGRHQSRALAKLEARDDRRQRETSRNDPRRRDAERHDSGRPQSQRDTADDV